MATRLKVESKELCLPEPFRLAGTMQSLFCPVEGHATINGLMSSQFCDSEPYVLPGTNGSE
jgi:hypothetical protein